MLLIKDHQIDRFADKKVNEFIDLEISNLKEKQPEKIREDNNGDSREKIRQILSWAKGQGIYSASGLEYLISICFKYSVSTDQLNSEPVQEIFNYPNREAEKKIVHLHDYLDAGSEQSHTHLQS